MDKESEQRMYQDTVPQAGPIDRILYRLVAEKIGLRLVSKKIRLELTLVNNLQLVMSRYICHKTYYTISLLQMKFRFDCYVREWFVCLLGRDQMNY